MKKITATLLFVESQPLHWLVVLTKKLAQQQVQLLVRVLGMLFLEDPLLVL